RFFTFVQWELAGRVGPPAGRYVVRRFAGDPAHHVVVVESTEAPRRRGLRGRRAQRSAAGGPEAGDGTRAPVSGAGGMDVSAAAAWLERAVESSDEVLASAFAVLTLAIHGYRIAGADPYARAVSAQSALVVRVGYGSGEQVADGRFEEARDLPPARLGRRRTLALAPQERLAALLAGRDVALACEELTLRARLDVDEGREREAALQLRAALEAALAELASWSDVSGIAARLDELRGLVPGVEAAARAALEG